jgi:hypothetical protein
MSTPQGNDAQTKPFISLTRRQVHGYGYLRPQSCQGIFRAWRRASLLQLLFKEIVPMIAFQ